MLKSLLSISLSLLLVATPLYAAPTDNQAAGEVKAVVPDASRNAQPVKVQDSLEWNDLLKTEAKGRLRASLSDGSILSLGSNSELQVVQHDAVSQQTLLVVNYGKLRSQVGNITKPDGKYEVRTPNAVIGVIGTDFYVDYANQRTTVICYVGKVAVTPAPGAKVLKSDNAQAGSTNTVTLTAGQMVVIGPDIPPGGYQPTSTPAELAEASMQDTNVPDLPESAAMLYSHGTALLNGNGITRSSAIFSGDSVQTNADSVANINATGSAVLVLNDSLVQYQGNAVKLVHGGVTVSTSKLLATRAGNVTVSPAAGVWTDFEVRDVDGRVQIAARKGDLTISDDTGTTTLTQGQQTTRDDSQSQNDDKKKKKREAAGARPAAAAGGGILTSPWAIGIGGGAIAGVTAWVLIQGDEPASPSR